MLVKITSENRSELVRFVFGRAVFGDLWYTRGNVSYVSSVIAPISTSAILSMASLRRWQ